MPATRQYLSVLYYVSIVIGITKSRQFMILDAFLSFKFKINSINWETTYNKYIFHTLSKGSLDGVIKMKIMWMIWCPSQWPDCNLVEHLGEGFDVGQHSQLLSSKHQMRKILQWIRSPGALTLYNSVCVLHVEGKHLFYYHFIITPTGIMFLKWLNFVTQVKRQQDCYRTLNNTEDCCSTC